jgi:hypothetical protein
MKTKSLTFLMLGIMLLAVPLSHAQEILYDGSFSTTTTSDIYLYDPPLMNVWCAFQNYSIIANPQIVDGVCYYQIESAGYEAWEVQLTQYGFILTPQHLFRLSFDVKADADRPFGLFLGEYYGSWTTLLGWDRYEQYATTEWQTITLDFKSACTFEINKLSFEMGGIDISMYFDNVMLEDLGPYEPAVGILGSSVLGWDFDVDMVTEDGVNYSLLNFPLVTGRAKFRQDDMWCVNWGGSTFPNGFATFYGPDIPVSNAGNYNILFNIETGEYSFTCDNNCSPFIGITGTAVPPDFGSGPDVDLITNDGIVYSLPGYTFTDGEAVFRQDNNPDLIWGGSTFPAGVATPDGGPIPVIAGTYSVTFNIVTGDYSFTYPDIGILGSALAGWDNDIDLVTTDGVIYTLSDYYFSEGEVKFRQNNNWDVNWGGYGFPSGWSWQNGPNIFVPEGTYHVYFNRTTGEYNFTATTCPIPGIQCPEFVYVWNDPGVCGAYVYYPDVVPAPNCGGEGIVIMQTEGLPSGSFFPLGSTWNAFVLTNAEGNTAECGFYVYVYDIEPPAITGVSDYFEPLWPPYHRMVPVEIDYSAVDYCGAAWCELYVFSNEPEYGLGDGDLAPDWEIIDPHNVMLRAERAGNGIGRVYTIVIVCFDEYGNTSFANAVVTVPHDMRKKKTESPATGSTDESAEFKVEVWPNPTAQQFNLKVESESDEIISVFISDITGRMIYSSDAINKETVSFGEKLVPGIYYVRVKQGEHFKTVKVAKQ